MEPFLAVSGMACVFCSVVGLGLMLFTVSFFLDL